MTEPLWQDLGPIEELKQRPLAPLVVGRTRIALSCLDGRFGAVSGVCNHAGGPLGEGTLEGEYLVCPWHHWKFHHRTGLGEPGYEEDAVPRYDLKEEGGRLYLNLTPASKRSKKYHEPHPLERPIVREPGPVRVLGISSTVMDPSYPRFSASDCLLDAALEEARSRDGVETRLIRLNDLRFRACEGYYSKSAHACTWPCSITQMDPTDQMDQVYEGVVFWADVILVSSPIRWGGPSSLYVKMVERMNCIQNQITIRNRMLLNNKVAAFIIMGGQDNVQAVAGQMLMFFAELGCVFPQFPFVAHSRGWDAEDMERNVRLVMQSQELRNGVRALTGRAVDMAGRLIATARPAERLERGGRKAFARETKTESGTEPAGTP
jgi:multimeric flavodoxin WrbA/nitrite reductase/ring-hydroxylating ferredoxin subunit